MSDQLKFSIDLSDKAKIILNRITYRPGLGAVVAQAMDAEDFNTVAAIKTKLRIAGKSKRGKAESSTGVYEYPHRITGRLQQSIGNTLAVVEIGGEGLKVRAAVGSGIGTGSNAVRYAFIQEHGGIVYVPSRPTRSTGRYGQKHPVTQAYSVTIPERAYIRPTIKERTNRYSARVSSNLVRFITGQSN